jgi:hypothetical protein
MFDSFNRHFSKRGLDNKRILVTTNVLETVNDLEDRNDPLQQEQMPDLDSIQLDDFSVLSDMIPATAPKIVSESEDSDIISSTALSAEGDIDDFQEI